MRNNWVPIQNLLIGVLSVSTSGLHLLRPTAFHVSAVLLLWTLEEIPVQPGAVEDALNHRHRNELHKFPPILRFHL